LLPAVTGAALPVLYVDQIRDAKPQVFASAAVAAIMTAFGRAYANLQRVWQTPNVNAHTSVALMAIAQLMVNFVMESPTSVQTKAM